jgi:hypothetical protein
LSFSHHSPIFTGPGYIYEITKKENEENIVLSHSFSTIKDRILIIEACDSRANRLYWVEMKMLKIRSAD